MMWGAYPFDSVGGHGTDFSCFTFLVFMELSVLVLQIFSLNNLSLGTGGPD